MTERRFSHPVAAACLAFAVDFAWAAAPAWAQAPATPPMLASPSGDIEVVVSDEGGRAAYEVRYKGEAVVGASRLGLVFRDAHGFDRNLRIAAAETATHDATWEQPWGERRFVRDRHNELVVDFEAAKGPERTMRVRLRAFDDGVGFRYEIPRQAHLGDVAITRELTEFAIDADATAWSIPAGEFNRYEYVYRETSAGDVEDAHTPITFRNSDGVHLSVHEAALVDYSGMSLQRTRPGVFRAALAPRADGALVDASTPFKTPWRTVQISSDAAGLMNSDLILNLNEPNKLGDVSWVDIGKYVGVWWAMHINERTWGSDGLHGATTEETKRYIDFAAEHGFDGVLVEGWNTGWDGDWYNNGEIFSFTEPYPDFDAEALAAYARERGVRLVGHHETSGHVSNYEGQLDAALDFYESLGVGVVKTGYVADAGQIERVDDTGATRYEFHDGQFMTGHHLRVVEAAAKRRIAVNAHEPVKDTGLRRTYPNWITREGARGQEFNAWGSPPNPVDHIATLAFTRMLSGPMDFTPGIFDLRPNERPPVREDMPRSDPQNHPQSTLAKQLALYVVVYSPIQMAADLPENYEERPSAFQFIKDVPTDWEESRALVGEVGDYVAIARKARGGEDWFLGAVTDEKARRLELSLDFLDEGRPYVAEIYRDGDDADWRTQPYEMTIERREAAADETLVLPLAPGGGAAVRLIPAPAN